MFTGIAYIVVFLAAVLATSSSAMALVYVWGQMRLRLLLLRKRNEVEMLELSAREQAARRLMETEGD